MAYIFSVMEQDDLFYDREPYDVIVTVKYNLTSQLLSLLNREQVFYLFILKLGNLEISNLKIDSVFCVTYNKLKVKYNFLFECPC